MNKDTRNMFDDLLKTMEDSSSPQERLKALRDLHGSQCDEEVETLYLLHRQQTLEDTLKLLRELRGAWSACDLSPKDHETGITMIEVFEHLLQEQRTRENQKETESLSKLWPSDPDLRSLYPWLTAWTGPTETPEKAPVSETVTHQEAKPREETTPEEPQKAEASQDTIDKPSIADQKAAISEGQVPRYPDGTSLSNFVVGTVQQKTHTLQGRSHSPASVGSTGEPKVFKTIFGTTEKTKVGEFLDEWAGDVDKKGWATDVTVASRNPEEAQEFSSPVSCTTTLVGAFNLGLDLGAWTHALNHATANRWVVAPSQEGEVAGRWTCVHKEGHATLTVEKPTDNLYDTETPYTLTFQMSMDGESRKTTTSVTAHEMLKIFKDPQPFVDLIA